MLELSEILIARHDLESFDQLVAAVRQRAASERFMRMDIRPPFADTPANWEAVLEAAFSSAAR